MAKKTKHFKGFSVVKGNIRIEVKFDRFGKQFDDAQFALDSAVMTSMVPFMPMNEGTFINVTKEASAALAGTGTVVAAAPPQGRFLYEGKTMVDELTGSPWARKGAKKVLIRQYTGDRELSKSLNENLNFNKAAHPNAQAHWFETAKKKDCKAWVKTVKKIAGGGHGR